MTDSGLNKIGKGAIIFIIGFAFSKLFGFFYKVIVARAGPYNYGLLSLGIGVFGFFGVFATMGLDMGIMRFVSYYREKSDFQRAKGIITSALKISFSAALILSILGFVFSERIAIGIFHNPDMTLILRILMVIIPFDALRKIFFSATKAFQHVQYETYSRDIIENITKLAFTIIVMIIGASAVGLTVAFSMGIIFSFLASAYFMEKKVFPVLRTSISSIKPYGELFNYSWPLMFSSLLFMLSLWTDSFLIGYFKDAYTVGIFNAAGPIAFLIYFFPLSLMAIFLPIITELKTKENMFGLESIYKTVTRWIFVSGLMIISVIMIFPKDIIMIIFGKDYLGAAIPLMILSVGYFINSLMFTSQRILMAFDKTKLIFVNTLCSFTVNIFLAVWLIPKYGIIGAAISTSGSFTMLSLIMMLQLRYVTRIRVLEKLYIFQAIPVVVAAGIAYMLSSYLQGVYSIIGIIIIPVVSLGIIFITKSFNNSEKELFMSAISKIKRKQI